MSYRVINGKLHAVGDFPKPDVLQKNNDSNDKKINFKDILNKEKNKSSFVLSNHAAQRLMERKINLNEGDMKKINQGINEAEKKGSKDSLIMYKDIVMVASIKNRTIITAMDKSDSIGSVFTNIDSVVLL